MLDNPVKRVLMIAYCFPPAGGIVAAGSQRALKFSKYLRAHDWEPMVLTVQKAYYEPYISMDDDLLEELPTEIKIVRTTVIRFLTKILELKNGLKPHSLSQIPKPESSQHTTSHDTTSQTKGRYQRIKDAFTELFEIPDEEIGWFLPALLKGIKTIKRDNIDIIYSTGRPWTAHLIGVSLKVITGKPFVAEFRDPWMTNPFRGNHSVLREKLETFYERKVIEKADLIIANTDELREEFIKRFPEKSQEYFITILNGFDDTDSSIDKYEKYSTVKKQNEKFTITHTGFLYGKRDPREFLEAINLLLKNHIIEPKDIQVFLIGNIELYYNIEEYLHANNLNTIVVLQEHVPYNQSLEYLRQADLLLLLQPGTKTQIPSKLFDYIKMRKPILAISPIGGATYNLMIKESIGLVVPQDDIQSIADAIYQLYNAWRNKSQEYRLDITTYHKFNVCNIVKNLSMQLSKLIEK